MGLGGEIAMAAVSLGGRAGVAGQGRPPEMGSDIKSLCEGLACYEALMLKLHPFLEALIGVGLFLFVVTLLAVVAHR